MTDSTWHSRRRPGAVSISRHAVRLVCTCPNTASTKFILDSPDTVVELNGQRVLNSYKTTSRVILAAGLHTLSITAEIEGPDQSVRVLWLNESGNPVPIPFGRLYRGSVRPVGLAGHFFEGDRTSGVPDSMQITPTMDIFHYSPVIPHPYTVVWEGTLQSVTLGPSRFKVSRTHSGEIALYVNNRLVAQDPPVGDTATSGEINLFPGQNTSSASSTNPHPARPNSKSSGPPAQGTYRPIPVELLTPAAEHMMQVVE